MPGLGLEFNILIVSRVHTVGTPYLPPPGLDPENLLARDIETHRLESGGVSRERRERMRAG